MLNKKSILSVFLSLIFPLLSWASDTSDAQEVQGALKCCASNSISYCDISSGHYVCSDGGYSQCICTVSTAMSRYAQLPLGCCLWHGGVAVNNYGQVICKDGTFSSICSIQSLTSTSVIGSSTGN
jgi:hypothetical protein